MGVLPGQYFDNESELHYNYHRFYDPSIGRYLRADPIGLAGGINHYTYGLNNPTNYIDPDGQLAFVLPAIPPVLAALGKAVAFVGSAALTAKMIHWLWNEKTKEGEQCEVGDLTDDEVEQIQNVVDDAGRPLDVVGSSAKGKRKENSDIDYVVGPSSSDHYRGKEGDLPGIDPEHGIIPGTHNPYQGPSIRFEPRTRPQYVPGAK
ncbi:MAG: RHS repeat-associated core domain-containing protein [Desulfobulbaceae bacterium]|nr:RHS repeat-associated core domain-containing protein [Desulfobulbaceae bacterium]